jgi:hypothetical protein
MKKLVFLLAAGLLCGGEMLGAQQLGFYRAAQGPAATAWYDFDNINLVDHGVFDATALDPSLPCLGSTAACIDVYNRRYGSAAGGGATVAPWHRKGSIGGEAVSIELIAAFFKLRGIPGAPTAVDEEDAKLIASGDTNYYYGVIVPAVATPPPPSNPCPSGKSCLSPCSTVAACVAPQTCQDPAGPPVACNSCCAAPTCVPAAVMAKCLAASTSHAFLPSQAKAGLRIFDASGPGVCPFLAGLPACP